LSVFNDIDVDAWEAKINPTILRENLFGVDLSPEAVEITALSLWIRTAERGKTLADLSHNIQCGNSVVSDPAVHPKAFNWQAAFPEVAKNSSRHLSLTGKRASRTCFRERRTSMSISTRSGPIYCGPKADWHSYQAVASLAQTSPKTSVDS
jgi:hypothetical protein